MVKIENVERKILKVEAFKVCFRHISGRNVRDDKKGIPQYSYKSAARDSWTVEDWKAKRFRPHYPGFEVDVKFGYDRIAYGHTKLTTVRDSYRIQ
jgi:hypothetical protein